MSPTLSALACRALALAGSALVLTGCGGSTTLAMRPVAERLASSPSPTAAAGFAIGCVALASGPRTNPTPTPPPDEGPTRAPSPRWSSAMAYDAARQDVVVFGGQSNAGGDLDDTWIWRDHHWTQVFPRHHPGARAYAGMAYDPVHRNVVLFGGLNAAGTWLWDGTDWTQAMPTFSPPTGVQPGLTFFARTGTVLLYGGDGMFNGPKAHVYSWDGTNWTDPQFTGGPSGTGNTQGWSVDPVRRVVDLVVGDFPTMQHWQFDGRSWTHLTVATPPTRSLVQTVTDERDHTIVLFGGVGVNDTWTWDGTRWTQRHPAHSPSSRSNTGPTPAIAYDAADREVVLFGGIDNTSLQALGDTWTWNGRDWHRAA